MAIYYALSTLAKQHGISRNELMRILADQGLTKPGKSCPIDNKHAKPGDNGHLYWKWNRFVVRDAVKKHNEDKTTVSYTEEKV